MKKWIYILIFIYCQYSVAQDIHYTQFESCPLNLNPGLTGNFGNDYRLVMNCRQQWQAVPVPYRTISSSFDTRITRFHLSRHFFGAGLLLNADKAGDSDFGTTQVKLLLAWHYLLRKDSSLIFSAGLNSGYNQNSIRFDRLYFDHQYVGGKYVPNADHGENLSNFNNRFSYFDFAAGMNILYRIKNTFLYSGISFIHLNKPQRSFFKETDIDLNRNYISYVQAVIPLNDQFNAIPSVFYMLQGKFHEFDFGGLIQYKMDNLTFRSFYLGGWLRAGDAGNIKMAVDYQDFTIGASYDINTSRLTEATNGRGGIELSIIYIFGKTKYNTYPVNRQCPTYM